MASSGVIALAGSGALLAACGTATGPVTARPISSGRSVAASPARAAGAGEAGTLLIQRSTLHGNPNDGFFTAGYPGIFCLGQGHPVVISSTIS